MKNGKVQLKVNRRGKQPRTLILKLDEDKPDKELEFELNFLQSLTTKQRFQMMFQKTKEMLDLLEKSGHRRPSQIIKRT
ncbi:hypothetical protein L6386_01515 [bacterium]|nr:hypothetical protein [bacterium]MCG2677234.1 hypothetical protein [bacterium]